MKVILPLILGGVFSAQIVFAQPVGDPEAGQKLSRQCKTCHGSDGVSKLPIAPNIGGETEAYLGRQLTAFRDGERYHEMMSVVAKGLDDQQIADVAAWYAGFQASAELAAADTEENAPQDCVACHGAAGIAEFEDAPNLAGETAMYIDTQLKAFRTGKRHHEIMSEVAAGMSDEEIRAAAEWYARATFSVTPSPEN